jgi:hypothetical protein
MSDLTQDQANKLFAQVSQAVQNDDSDKLSTILAQETPQVEEQPIEDTPAEDEPADDVEVDDTTPTDEVDDKDDVDTPAPEAGNDKQDDPLEALRAEIARLREEQNAIKSQTGRISAVQSRLAKYDKQLAELTSATSSQTVDKVTPKVNEALKDLEVTDPALAKTIRDVMATALGGVASESNAQQIAQIEALREADYEVYRQEQTEALLTKYPNAGQVFKSPHWAEWKNSQPKHIVDLATSDSADAVGMALELYRADMIRQHPELATQTKVEAPAAAEVKVDPRAQQIEEERKRQQKTTAVLDSGKPPARAKEPDADALFKKVFNEQLKEITGK